MKVIADLYGEGDPNNKHARREFREIKEAVLADVSDLASFLAAADTRAARKR